MSKSKFDEFKPMSEAEMLDFCVRGKSYTLNGRKCYSEGEYIDFNTICIVYFENTKVKSIAFGHPRNKSIKGVLKKNLATKYYHGMVLVSNPFI